MLKPESWAVIAVATFGIVAAVFAYLKTPPARRRRWLGPTAEERLAASPPGDRAVIIRADRRRAFRRDLPWFIALLPVAALAIWFEGTHGNPCASLFGVGRTRLALAAVMVMPPVLVAAAGAVAIVQAVRAFRGGYWPPLDTPVYTDTLAISGTKVRLRAVAVLLLFAALLALLAVGYVRSAEFLIEGKLGARLTQTEAKCLQAGR